MRCASLVALISSLGYARGGILDDIRDSAVDLFKGKIESFLNEILDDPRRKVEDDRIELYIKDAVKFVFQRDHFDHQYITENYPEVGAQEAAPLTQKETWHITINQNILVDMDLKYAPDTSGRNFTLHAEINAGDFAPNNRVLDFANVQSEDLHDRVITSTLTNGLGQVIFEYEAELNFYKRRNQKLKNSGFSYEKMARFATKFEIPNDDKYHTATWLQHNIVSFTNLSPNAIRCLKFYSSGCAAKTTFIDRNDKNMRYALGYQVSDDPKFETNQIRASFTKKDFELVNLKFHQASVDKFQMLLALDKVRPKCQRRDSVDSFLCVKSCSDSKETFQLNIPTLHYLTSTYLTEIDVTKYQTLKENLSSYLDVSKETKIGNQPISIYTKFFLPFLYFDKVVENLKKPHVRKLLNIGQFLTKIGVSFEWSNKLHSCHTDQEMQEYFTALAGTILDALKELGDSIKAARIDLKKISTENYRENLEQKLISLIRK